MSKSARVCLLSLLAAGCAAPLTYVDPVEGERARVRFATGTNGVTVLRGYDDSGCRTNEKEWMRLIDGNAAFADSAAQKQLGLPGAYHHRNAAKEVYVDASRQQTLMFTGNNTYGTTVHRCGVPLTFKFEKDRDYEVAYHLAPLGCSVTVFQLSPTAPVRTKLRTFDNRITEETAVCLDQFKKMRWN